MDLRDINRLFAYTEWANDLIIRPCEALTPEQLTHDFGTGQRSVLGTLAHMVGAEWTWLERWSLGGGAIELMTLKEPISEIEPAAIASLRTGWQELNAKRHAFLAGLTETTLHEALGYTNMRGEMFSHPLVDQLVHVVNHATHHRGQVVGFLRAFDVKPPVTDMIHYFRSAE